MRTVSRQPLSHPSASTGGPDHIVLLGDSTIDNGLYTGGMPDVAHHLRSVMPEGRITSLALDGATCRTVRESQAIRIPTDATHIVLSVGGNDALPLQYLLDADVGTVGESLARLDAEITLFEDEYRRCVRGVLTHDVPVTVCTIYNGDFPEEVRDGLKGAVRMFNDAIMKVAAHEGLPVIDLRAVCFDSRHYYNPIEPNGRGGLSIARAIALATDRSARILYAGVDGSELT